MEISDVQCFQLNEYIKKQQLMDRTSTVVVGMYIPFIYHPDSNFNS